MKKTKNKSEKQNISTLKNRKIKSGSVVKTASHKHLMTVSVVNKNTACVDYFVSGKHKREYYATEELTLVTA